MYCMYCGAPCPEEAAFCTSCGRQVQSTSLRDGTASGSSSMTVREKVLSGTDFPLSPWQRQVQMSAKWIRRVGIPLAVLAWIGLVAAVLWAASHVARTLVLLAIAAILAFALAPLVRPLRRFLPHLLSILLVYIVVMGGICFVLFFLFRTAVFQAMDLKNEVSGLLQPGHASSLDTLLASLGLNSAQLHNVRQAMAGHVSELIGGLVPALHNTFDIVVDVIVVTMLSIYLLIDGARVFGWLRDNMPTRLQKHGFFLLETLQRVAGGYIRGQLILSLLIGVLVGAGMAIFRLPHAVLLGALAFLLAFIPLFGTFISGALCVLLALTATTSWVVTLTGQTWILALIVLFYFTAMHFIESHIVGPRVVGRAVGLHPIISIAALIAGTELFGILGALFVVPLVGMLQVIIAELWREWRASHPDQFPGKQM